MDRRAVLAAMAAVLASPAVLRRPAAAAGLPLVLTYVPSNSAYWDLDVAIEKGFFRDQGFAPEVVVTQSSPQSIQQAITQQVQLAASQPEPFIAAVERGASALGIIAAPVSKPDWLLNVRGDIQNVEDLKGKNIGVSGMRVGESWLTQRLLLQHGLGAGDYGLIQVGATNLKYAALQRGSISAAPLFQPTALLAETQGYRALARYEEIGSYPTTIYVVNRAWAAQDSNGKRLSAALVRAHEWLFDPANRAEAVAILAKYTKREPPILERLSGLYFAENGIYTRDAALDLAATDRLLADMAQDGDIFKVAPRARKYAVAAADGGVAR